MFGCRWTLFSTTSDYPGEADTLLLVLEEILAEFGVTNHQIVIARDFNIDGLKDYENETEYFHQLLNSFGMHATMKEPKRTTPTTRSCTDNIVTDRDDCTAKIIPTIISDHDTVQIIQLHLLNENISLNHIHRRMIQKDRVD
ncbi:hypothetical protein HHI36_019797 [Cryptolaemus montrouzieri]|uniref:Uncharacterized protein n=1 Tax=Cryptolaemus montrouzieri TaxID=559131 RepID=A0ABD2N8E5_9CUCU